MPVGSRQLAPGAPCGDPINASGCERQTVLLTRGMAESLEAVPRRVARSADRRSPHPGWKARGRSASGCCASGRADGSAVIAGRKSRGRGSGAAMPE